MLSANLHLLIFFSERQRKFKEKICADPIKLQQYNEKARMKNKAAYNRKKNDPLFKKLRNERQRIRQAELKKLEIEKNIRDEVPSLGNYKSKSSFGKAAKKTGESLPKSSPNRKAVIRRLYFENFPCEKKKVQRLGITNDIDEIVKGFYQLDNISQQLPGKKDFRTIRHADRSIEKIQKRVMLLTLSETFNEFKKSFPESQISKSKFYKLKPIHISSKPRAQRRSNRKI